MGKKNSFFNVICLLFSVFFLIFSVGCKKKEAKKQEERIVNVQVHAAEKRPLRPFLETIGTLNPYEEVIVSAEVDGIIRNIRVNEGSAVSKNMTLASIDDTDYVLEVNRAESALKQAEATLDNTRLEHKRKETLFQKGYIERQQLDDISTKLSLADAELERAKASLSLAKQRLSKTKIISPLSGVIKEKKVERGNYVKNSMPLFTIIQNNPLKLDFTIPEKDIGKIKAGEDVLFKVDAFPDREFKGKVSIVYPNLEEKTRTLQVEALAPNSDGLLKPGLFSHIRMYAGRERDTILVPVSSLLYEGEKAKVFIAEGNVAKERPVTIGQKYTLASKENNPKPVVMEFTEITDGVREGELIITVGQQNLSENTKINIVY